MKTRPVTYMEAADLIVAWSDRRISTTPSQEPIDFSLEDDCDALCRWLADDPERNLDDVPPELIRHLRARLVFVIGVCGMRKHEIIGRVPESASDEQVLSALLGAEIASTRLPAEWRPQ